ncbi:MAG TPA: sulfotransferase [Phycisphaerales bacterium]|nr:sulfotransferase [Phycisphaerales bacterium]
MLLDPIDRVVPLPYPHFMGFAPLDTWARLLAQGGAMGRIHPRYYPRVLGALFTSTLATAVTLPERLVLAPLLPKPAMGDSASAAGSTPEVVFILGYYRSGTTHLHYLLSCDPRLATPRWYQMLAPQGFALSWTFLRYFLVPFLSSKRPQDDVAYGPEYPAEDDFGVCNLSAACAMPGRMVLPGCWDFYSRFHSLEGLSERELRRFRRAQLAITWKMSRVNRGRMLLLKTPSHTARVAELARLYPNARFIHLHREPGAVVKSNVAMHRRFAPFLLQPHPGDEEIRRRVVAEYEHTERKFLAEAAAVPGDRLVRMRYEDLIADPIGQIRAAYERLGLTMSAEFESRAGAYLETVRNYRTAAERGAGGSAAAAGEKTDDRMPLELEWMHHAFGHDRPAIAAAPLPARPVEDIPEAERPLFTGASAALVAAAFCFAAWILIAAVFRNRIDFLAWPTGVAIGLAALRGAGANGKRGTLDLGLWALLLTLLVLLGAAYPATWLAVRDRFSPINLPHHVWLATRRGVLAMNNIIWLLLGLTSAYRYASRQHIRPPGL